jgi:predicted metal-dependent peptidase
MKAKKLFSPTDDLSSVKCYIASLLILQSKAPVHYSVVIATEVIWTDALPTAGTDGVYVYVNPSFFRGLGSDSQRAFLLAHEASHIIMRHPMRGKMYKDRGAFVGGLRWDHGTYNLAADYIINSDCISMGFEPIPQGCYSEQYGRDDLTDNVYAELLGNQSEPPEPPKGEDEGGEEGSGEEGGDPAPRDDEGDGDDDSDSGSGVMTLTLMKRARARAVMMQMTSQTVSLARAALAAPVMLASPMMLARLSPPAHVRVTTRAARRSGAGPA